MCSKYYKSVSIKHDVNFIGHKVMGGKKKEGGTLRAEWRNIRMSMKAIKGMSNNLVCK